jgi:hypothetical protein
VCALACTCACWACTPTVIIHDDAWCNAITHSRIDCVHNATLSFSKHTC